jgi:hypothetical protein
MGGRAGQEDVSEPLMDDALFPVATPSYWRSLGEKRPNVALAKARLLHDRDPNTTWDKWFAVHAASRIDLPTGSRFTSSDLVLRAASHGWLGSGFGSGPTGRGRSVEWNPDPALWLRASRVASCLLVDRFASRAAGCNSQAGSAVGDQEHSDREEWDEDHASAATYLMRDSNSLCRSFPAATDRSGRNKSRSVPPRVNSPEHVMYPSRRRDEP